MRVHCEGQHQHHQKTCLRHSMSTRRCQRGVCMLPMTRGTQQQQPLGCWGRWPPLKGQVRTSNNVAMRDYVDYVCSPVQQFHAKVVSFLVKVLHVHAPCTAKPYDVYSGLRALAAVCYIPSITASLTVGSVVRNLRRVDFTTSIQFRILQIARGEKQLNSPWAYHLLRQV